ncbi:Bcl-2-related ovarian killer protein [Sciurus carolinensis]|uniref:Bcl-2-related ovarian killer protein n=1 Tax=Sciurus carolinensis TaxID=30640 RepID=A0AA41SXT8_SCICA|nr:Bcl-2-related ovarian killer protein [Sciurus carolinensis]
MVAVPWKALVPRSPAESMLDSTNASPGSGAKTDVLRYMVSMDPGLHAHWLVDALCSFGCFLKAVFFVLLPEI